jgi:ubiquinone/menaquinone biosynthesis C-methylase UbiE
MISRSDDYVEYCRETAKHASDAHDLALRGRDKKEVTRLIHECIAEAVDLHAGDDLVDIGCGDGSLLRIARRVGVRSAVGLLATDEEVALLLRFGLEARQAFTDKLPLPDQYASVIVCNNVLLVVPREKIPASLEEIHRIAKPGARIYLGEIPFLQPADPTPTFNTRCETLAYLYRKHGLRTWFGMLRRMTWWVLRGQPAVLRPGTAISFFAKPHEFIAMGQEAGLEFVRYWQHNDPDTRNNYLFRKAG